MVDIKADDIAICVEIDYQALNNLSRFDSGGAAQLNIETVRFWIIVQLHVCSSRKFRSK